MLPFQGPFATYLPQFGITNIESIAVSPATGNMSFGTVVSAGNITELFQVELNADRFGSTDFVFQLEPPQLASPAADARPTDSPVTLNIWLRYADVAGMPRLRHRSGLLTPVSVLRWAGLAMLLVVLTACIGEPVLDRDIDETRNREFSVKISVVGASPSERLAAESPGLTLILSETAAEILGTSTETPLAFTSISSAGAAFVDFNLFGIDATSGRWCDIGAMSIRDDLTGETFEFLHADECLRMGNILVDGIWNEQELGFRKG